MDTKFIMGELNKSPFNKNYTYITFDSLQPDELLQVVSDVLCQIDGSDRVEIQLEDPEQTVVRLFNALRVLKYKPPDSTDVGRFKRGIIDGEKSVLHPILKWLLNNAKELKNRAYLARYLVKIAVPNDVMGDSDVANLYRQYLALIEEFTKTHKESTRDANKITTSELISDCGAIEREKEIVSARIDQLRKKVDLISNNEQMLKLCHQLRLERDARKDNAQQLKEELGLLQRARQQVSRLSQQLQELKTDDATTQRQNLSPNELLTNLHEEAYVISYLAEHKLPRQLTHQQKALQILRTIRSMDSSTNFRSDGNTINTLEAKVVSLMEQLNRLKLLSSSKTTIDHDVNNKSPPYDAGSTMIRMVAGGVKDSLATKFFELKMSSQRLSNELKMKRDKLQTIVRDTGMAVGDEFQEYVKKLRAQSLIYKRQRSDLAFLKNEATILSRTLTKLQTKKHDLGVGDDDQQPNNNNNNNNAADDGELLENDEDFLQWIARLTKNIDDQKSKIIPLIDDIKPLKDDFLEIRLQHEERKRLYDKTSAALDSNLAKLQQEVSTLREDQLSVIRDTRLFEANAAIGRVNLERANNESQMQTEKVNSTPTLRERYHRKIAESERLGKLLKDEQKTVIAAEEASMKQKELWNNLYTLLAYKRKALQNEQAKSGIFHLGKGSETLVLLN